MADVAKLKQVTIIVKWLYGCSQSANLMCSRGATGGMQAVIEPNGLPRQGVDGLCRVVNDTRRVDSGSSRHLESQHDSTSADTRVPVVRSAKLTGSNPYPAYLLRRYASSRTLSTNDRFMRRFLQSSQSCRIANHRIRPAR